MPTSIFELYRGSYGSELLTAAVCHFQVFAKLESGAKTWDELRQELGLARRPMHVLVTALRAMQLIERTESGGIESLRLTTLARQYLAPGSYEDVSGYIGLSVTAPGVLEMVERLRTNRPAGAAEPDAGAAFIFRDGLESAMEREAT
ncbi:MAG TPA: methyltransferase dimerization domain-containing protein, partial [Pirellulaceae bacterium]|nr:methyltransferase dimerization domain-containing protein [Pirellulaceae bacterium]